MLLFALLCALPKVRLGAETTYVAYGGSNTCGHHISFSNCTKQDKVKCKCRNSCTFYRKLSAWLYWRGIAKISQNRCVAAMGPEIVSLCPSAHIPAHIGFATVEYLPNMSNTTLARESFDSLLRLLHARGVHTVVVEVYPWETDVTAEIHAKNVQLARELGMPVVLARSSEERMLFGNSLHLSAEGNVFIFQRVSELFEALRAAREGKAPIRVASRSLAVEPDTPARSHCALGKELNELVLESTSFALRDIDDGRHAQAKYALVSTAPDAHLELCAGNGSFLSGNAAFLVGFQMSHRLNLPLVGVASVLCTGVCKCSQTHRGAIRDCDPNGCAFDTLHAVNTTVTGHLRLRAVIDQLALQRARIQNEPCACRVLIRNSPLQDRDTRSRVMVRSLITMDEKRGTRLISADVTRRTK